MCVRTNSCLITLKTLIFQLETRSKNNDEATNNKYMAGWLAIGGASSPNCNKIRVKELPLAQKIYPINLNITVSHSLVYNSFLHLYT